MARRAEDPALGAGAFTDDVVINGCPAVPRVEGAARATLALEMDHAGVRLDHHGAARPLPRAAHRAVGASGATEPTAMTTGLTGAGRAASAGTVARA